MLLTVSAEQWLESLRTATPAKRQRILALARAEWPLSEDQRELFEELQQPN